MRYVEHLRRLALAAVLALSAAAAVGQVFSGRMVNSVSCIADGPIDQGEIGRLVAIRAGQPLSEEDMAATIVNLYATRRFADVRIEATSEGDSIAVMIVLFRAFRIRPLVFAGTVPISRGELRKALPFGPGALYTSEAVEQGARALERRLQADGFLSAQVQAQVVFDRKKFDARVTYAINPGPAALAAEPFFDGDPSPFSPTDLTSRMRMKPGSRYREGAARADASRIEEFLHDKERYRATVELIAAQPIEDGRVMPVYRLRVGPHVVFEATGIKPEKLAKELHALAESQPIDEELVLQFVEARKESLQRSGYYRANVTYGFDARSDPSVTRIRVDIVPGPKLFVEKVAFEGDLSVPAGTLYGLMATREKGLPLIARGRLVDSDLAQDVETILAYYQSLGWVRVRVSPPRVTDGSKPGALLVTIGVKEGPRAFVEGRALEGAEHLGPEAEAELLSVKDGAPLNPNAVREDVGRLSGWYHDRGWREAAVRDEVALSEDGTKARVTYHVDEGMKSFFGKTIIRGNTRTATVLIERLVAWKEGDVFSESMLLDAQRKLSRSGVFRRVDIRPQRVDPATQSRNVEIEVEEGRPWSLLYGVGYQYTPGVTQGQNDPYLTGGVSYNNIFGRMISAGFEAQYEPITQQGRVQGFLREPFLFGTNYPLNFLGFYARETISDVPLERRGVTLDSFRLVAPGLRLGLRYTYQRIQFVDPSQVTLIDLIGLPAINRPIDESTIGPDILFDRRDDIIDPHSGYYAFGSFKYAFPFLSAKTQFTKFSTQATGFLPLGRRWTLVGSARLGGIFDLSTGRRLERLSSSPEARNSVHCAELHSERGALLRRRPLERASLRHGPARYPGPDRGLQHVRHDAARQRTRQGHLRSPVSDPGGVRLHARAEHRGRQRLSRAERGAAHPDLAGNLAGVVFYDAAQVWQQFYQLRFQFEGETGLRQGAGFGLRYMTPIGPARVEYGWPLMPRTIAFDIIDATDIKDLKVIGHSTTKEKGRFFFSIGYPF